MPLTNAGAAVCLSGPGLVAATRYIALYVGDPSGSGIEVSALGYVRLERTVAQMTVADNVVLVAAGEWEDSALESWGSPTWCGVLTAVSGGLLLAYAVLAPAPGAIPVGTEVSLNAGDISITIPLS